MQNDLNLFFATRPGQLRNIVSYVSQTGRDRCRLIALTTQRESALRCTLKSSIQDNLFERVEWPVLPGAPAARMGIVKRGKVFSVFKRALEDILADCTDDVVRVHLFHPSAYYIYVLRILAQMNVRVEGVVLLEEGLSSYKWCALPYGVDTYGRAAGIHGLKDVLVAAKDALLPENVKFGIIETFDEGWFRFPDAMAASRQLSFMSLHRLQMDVAPLDARSASYVNNAPHTLFIGQRFGECSISVETIVSILDLMGVDKILYKPHPAEDPRLLNAVLKDVCERYPRIAIERIPELDVVLSESLVASGHFSSVVSLTSTSLVYSPRSENTRFISVAAPFVELYPLVYKQRHMCEMPSDHLRLLERDAAILASIAPDVEMPGWLSRSSKS